MKQTKFLLLTLLFGWLSVSYTIDTRTEKRIALVIGNSNYYNNELDLENPVNDAQAMKEVLEGMDFEVMIVKNGTKSQIYKALNDFDDKNLNINKKRYKSVALFYYSGHGMNVNETNYLIPTDAYIKSPADLDEFAISSDWIVNRMDEQSNYLSLLMFDACRDNPLTKSMARYFKRLNPTKSALYDPSVFSALKKKEKKSTGIIVSYASDAGETAESGDGGGRYSPYVASFLNNIKTPNLQIETLLKRVGSDVVTQSRGTQHPTVMNKFYKEFSFKTESGRDYDGDGVIDTKDKCPTVYARTADGCPPSKPIVTPKPKPQEYTFAPKMIKVQGGSFQMGSNDGANDEKPVHTVTVPTFWMGKYEVTVKEYLAFCKATNSNYPKWLEKGNEYHVETGSNDYYKKKGYSRTGSDNLPIVGVSWNDAKAYCKWLSEETGQNYRLPSEAEWEYAARGGKQSKGYKYSGSNEVKDVAWYTATTNDSGTKEVGTKDPNELGIHDMSGNVWEWCEDTWHNNYKGAPSNGSTWVSASENARVLRGGSWDYYNSYCRVADRVNNYPTLRYYNVGFRVARGD